MISLAQFTLAYTRGWAANTPNSRIRLKAELDRAHQEITLMRDTNATSTEFVGFAKKRVKFRQNLGILL